MSVYIKDMEMPVDCLACRIACDKESYRVVGRPTDCPLTEATDLISRAEAIEAMGEEPPIVYDLETEWKEHDVWVRNVRALSELPSSDAVRKGVLEQFRWERDVAMAQLEEYGIPFGTDKDEDMVRVVRCKDCRFWKNEHLCLVMSRYGSIDTKAEHYCSYGERSK